MTHQATPRDRKPEAGLRIRRSRRTDFVAVMRLLAASGVPVPAPDRATLRRFRRVVDDLGADFYLILVDGTLAGLVHVTYARQVAGAPRARLDQLVVAEPFRRRGIGAALLAFAQTRARRRGCGTLCCWRAPDHDAADLFLERAGLRAMGTWFVQELQAGNRD